MGSFAIKQKGSFRKIERFLAYMTNDSLYQILDHYGQVGVRELSIATPAESGVTAASWNYYIDRSSGQSSITWTNDHYAGTTPVVILLQYGHGTGTGGYVRGYDFINPAIRPVMDNIADAVWKAVISA